MGVAIDLCSGHIIFHNKQLWGENAASVVIFRDIAESLVLIRLIIRDLTNKKCETGTGKVLIKKLEVF